MALLNRNSLKNFFKGGNSPSEVNFSDLIDSTVNKMDDGFAKNSKDGLMLSPTGGSKRLLSFFENIRDQKPDWFVTFKDDKKIKGLSFQQGDKSSLFLKDGGAVGIGTDNPNYPLEVEGMVGMGGRIGATAGLVPGDRNWHSIIHGLDGIQAFEIVACIKGPKGRGKYAFTHAIAVSTFGKSWSSIRHTRAYFGWFWNRISLRWKGDIHNFSLQVRTLSNYGFDENNQPRMIEYHITKLWGAGTAQVTGINGYGESNVGMNGYDESEIEL